MAKDYGKVYSTYTKDVIKSFRQEMEPSLPDFFYQSYTATYPPQMLEAYKHEYLLYYWFRKYPMLFDRDDLWLACRDQKVIGNHFGEWLGAILFYEHHGYLSLVEKYENEESQCHKRKGKIFKSIVDSDIFEYVKKHFSQPPDLFLFSATEQIFCEIKRKKINSKESPTKNQPEHFRKLQSSYGKKVVLLTLQEGY
ncbi:hypothetical protein [Geomonas anaerohicana]|uniref:Uncharacterized protein n=1 Tax=Geomonas anaerohicana TaxID=2798583 RepID=A0ABS0YC43_9BACT|nr:hypothetical protein [Geomonas anaerohicana]MBJ6749883.1 hypothetical protein [Geomonas anaerohicana]